MKLLACHIDNFGKLSDVTLQFYDGLNVINEANGWGKSTFAAFLKAMFYGLDTKKNVGDFEKERVMYRPWQGGAFGGEVEFELDGKGYRVSRTFGRTEKTDEFHLYDLSTNLEVCDFSEELGNEIFELDSASFKRSIYIAQNDCASETSDSINAKLGNLAENTNDINNFENANKQLKEILNQLTPDRITGSIKKRKNYMTQLAQELRSFEAAQDGLIGIKAKEQQVFAEIEKVQEVRKNYSDALVVASEDSRRKALYAQYDAICKEVEEKEQKRDAYNIYFPNGIPTEEEFQMQMQNIAKMKEMQNSVLEYAFSPEEIEKYNQLSQVFDAEVPKEEEIDTFLQMFQEIDKQKEEITRQEAKISALKLDLHQKPDVPKFSGEGAHKICLIVGVVIALLGAGSIATWYFDLLPMIDEKILLLIAVGAGVCGVILGIISAIFGVRVSNAKRDWQSMVDEENEYAEGKVKNLDATITTMKEDVRKVYATMSKFLATFHIYCEVNEYQQKLYELKAQALEYLRMKEKQSTRENKKGSYEELHKELMGFIQRYQFHFEEEVNSLNQLQTKATEYHMAEAAYKEACLKKETFEQQQDKSFWTRQAICPYSLEELNEWIAQADERLETLKNTKNQYKRQLE
ncbi:MAG: AAA family ATPase, partial [Agathobacter sp.]|nr:AAA family ATPase [Agathobacter sp.]